MLESYPDLLTPAQVQEILFIGRTKLYNLLRCGEIKQIRIGRQIRVPKKYLIEFISGLCYNSHLKSCVDCLEGGKE